MVILTDPRQECIQDEMSETVKNKGKTFIQCVWILLKELLSVYRECTKAKKVSEWSQDAIGLANLNPHVITVQQRGQAK